MEQTSDPREESIPLYHFDHKVAAVDSSCIDNLPEDSLPESGGTPQIATKSSTH